MTDLGSDSPEAGADGSEGATPDRYGHALEELEELLEELEDADIDVDHLAARVARGVELVRFCRERLSVVTADVDQVVADLLADDTDEPPADDSAAGYDDD